MSVTLNGNPEYRFIRAWGSMMGSFPDYVDEQVDLAIEMDAPERAIYYDDGREDWVTIDEKPIVTRMYIEDLVKEM